jgi:hypothetical protein
VSPWFIPGRRWANSVILFLGLLIAILPAEDMSPVVQEMRVARLIESLHGDPWPCAENNCNPTCWDFRFTEPMKALPKVGSPAQQPLIDRLSDPAITDQVVVLRQRPK